MTDSCDCYFVPVEDICIHCIKLLGGRRFLLGYRCTINHESSHSMCLTRVNSSGAGKLSVELMYDLFNGDLPEPVCNIDDDSIAQHIYNISYLPVW
jgi:hypothetical protein